MSQPVVTIRELSRRFGSRIALDRINLTIPQGAVYGLVGGNGAGKTTLIKHILGLLHAEEGMVQVFGYNPVADPPAVLSRIGYLSEERDIAGWMRVDELLNYTRAFFPDWDPVFARELLDTFELSVNQKVKTLSRGQLARVGLLTALAHRPPLLLLDEPSSGLDPVVRKDILGAIIRTVADEGRTVLFSSHLLDEVERVADQVAMLSNGRLVLNDSLDNIKSRQRVVTVRFLHELSHKPLIPGLINLDGSAAEWKYLCPEGTARLRETATSLGAEILEESIPSLDEIFEGHSRRP
ncbi:MAG: ytrB [Planctomycetaceae bacterium]|nr:ytrB [Planctomycetaceae bacterium]